MPTFKTTTPLFEVLGARNVFLKRLENLGIKTVGDLLYHFPSRYEDFSKISAIIDLTPGQEATIYGVVKEIRVKNAWRRRMSVTEAIIEDESGSIRAVWFNQPYIATSLRAGRMANFSGKVSLSREGDMYFNNPAHEIIHNEIDIENTKHTARLVPVYPETRSLTSRGLRFMISGILKRKITLNEWIPEEILNEHRFPKIQNAIETIHFPDTIEEATQARRRFSFEDLFLLQLVNETRKRALAEEKAHAIPENIERIKEILEKLPFELTPSQKRSLWEIIQDMGKPHPMNRLLQGDVGSGKTIVAAIAAIIAAENGFQTAFMAPTEILAQQHFGTFKKFLAHIAPDKKPVTGIITANNTLIFYEDGMEAKNSKEEFWRKAAAGEIDIIFGTHALITSSKTKTANKKTERFKKLGLVIVDEQHRFGVRQRQALLKETSAVAAHPESDNTIPHFLSMSATPIPRTLMMTVFGDLDVSLITELPSGRKPIETKIVPSVERNEAYEKIRAEIKSGRQAFVICPRIEAEEIDDDTAKKKKLQDPWKSVIEEYEKLSKVIFPDLRVAMLHGKMKPREKEDVMRDFKEGKSDILVATSVIEVGVDIPNATIMMIESADRFGLAQLYQFRGRVGRGEYGSQCFLFTDADTGTAKARLQAIVSAKNGFELAEKDLAIRGPGEFFGEAQSGFSDAALEALRDPLLVKQSRDATKKIIDTDPQINRHPELAVRLVEFKKNLHLE